MPQFSALIVDDDTALASAMDIKLSKAGFTTTVASDGDEAIELLRKDKFDVVLLDLHMPKVNGIEVLKQKKTTQNAETPCYVITNLGSDHYCEEAIAEGAKDCFVKSRITLEEIVHIVEKECM